MYAGGARPKVYTPTTTPTTEYQNMQKSPDQTGVTDPKEMQEMIQETQAQCSHRRNLAVVDRLIAPLQQYVEQGE